eukprot:7232718-Prymnesium_polylepis.1
MEQVMATSTRRYASSVESAPASSAPFSVPTQGGSRSGSDSAILQRPDAVCGCLEGRSSSGWQISELQRPAFIGAGERDSVLASTTSIMVPFGHVVVWVCETTAS